MDAMRAWTPLSPGTALPLDRPSVFLESTVIAQGLPWPENLETALALVAAVQESGAVPFGVKPCVMATGGLGGVHRAAAETFDVSTDLDELARADGSVVVCSGFKSILDLTATLEALETRVVVIVGYRTSELPAFITASSGLPLDQRVETPEAAAAVVRTHRKRVRACGPTKPCSSPTLASPHRSPSRFLIEHPRAARRPGTPHLHTCLKARKVTITPSMSRTRGSGMFWGKIPITSPVEVASGAGFTRI
jgi:hypothetical protein